MPEIDGIEQPKNVFTLRQVEDADHIKQFITDHKVKTVTIIGAGIASLEITENLYLQGITVNIVEQRNQVGFPYDSEIADLIQKELETNGVHINLNETVKKVEFDGSTMTIADGSHLEQDMIIVATGVVPNTEFLKGHGN